MRILHINTLDVQGGAARAAHRLHRGLLSIGADSTYFVREKRVVDDTVRKFIPDPSPAAVAHRAGCKAEREARYDAYAETRSPHLEHFSHEWVDADENFFIQRPRADIINLHWISEFVDYRLFFTPQRTDVPLVWTLHDMNPVTGGCHFDNGCGKFQSHCGACPLLGSNEEQDLTWKIFESKVKIFGAWPGERLHIVGPSQWTRDMAKSSALFRKYDATWIPHSINIEVFKPLAKAAARAALKLPQDAHIVLFMSHNVALPRKGLRELIQALSMLPDTSKVLLLVAGDSKHAAGFSAPFRMVFVDYIGDDATVATLYAAVDVTAVPSKQDVGPLTMLESMSCGTPVVGFNVGGVPDMVWEGETGFLAPPGNVGALSAAFMSAFSDQERLKQDGVRGRALVEEQYSPRAQASAYLALYQQLLEGASKR
ncbi:MAG: glycosyltransferase [Rhodospirillaceae bacterium]|nr:glycosyltransferase [Rhodospirillaceae bacterium]